MYRGIDSTGPSVYSEKAARVDGVMIDRERLRKLLLQSQRAFQDFAEGCGSLVWYVLFKPERKLYVNPVFTLIWGFERQELYRNPQLWTSHIYEEDRLRVERCFLSWLSGGAAGCLCFNYRVVRSDGCLRQVRDVVSGLFENDGSLCGTLGIGEDITGTGATEASHSSTED
jgi:PAS domain S-box-containing protein